MYNQNYAQPNMNQNALVCRSTTKLRLTMKIVTPYRIMYGHYTSIIIMLFAIVINCAWAKRGPHHPHSEVNKHRIEQQQHINQHLAYEKQHIEEDLSAHKLPTEKSVDDMTEEEKNYLYFKVHDLDGNDKLDGLEIYYSATHHSVSQNDQHLNHHHQERQDDAPIIDESSTKSIAQLTQSNGSVDPSHLKLLEKDENGELIEKNFNHIIDILDNFLHLADLNQDGYLNYAEYAAAVQLGNAIAHPEINEDL